MIATRSPRIGALLPMAVAAGFWLGLPGPGFAQASKAKVMPPAAKAEAKKIAEAAKDPIDLNSATAEELQTLPGIGDAYARRIIEGRPHKSVAELSAAGLPGPTVDKIKPMVVAHPLPPAVDVNEAPVSQLETLPGVGPALAKEIVAGRPYHKYEDLSKVKGIGPAKLDGLHGRLKFGTASPSAPKVKKAEAEERIVPRPVASAVGSRSNPNEAVRPASGSKVELNTASKAELDALPGIGPVKAQAIIDARPFGSIEDVMKVRGIKEGEFSRIKDLITVKK